MSFFYFERIIILYFLSSQAIIIIFISTRCQLFHNIYVIASFRKLKRCVILTL